MTVHQFAFGPGDRVVTIHPEGSRIGIVEAIHVEKLCGPDLYMVRFEDGTHGNYFATQLRPVVGIPTLNPLER